MQLHLISIGKHMPAWVNQGYQEYAKRFPRDFSLQLTEIPISKRSKTMSIEQSREREGKQMLACISDRAHVVALEVKGEAWDTPRLATQLSMWRDEGRDVCLLIGGPDGLAPACIARAKQQWSLSPLTLPHGLVRVVVAEQLYRAFTILQGHPYHRG